MNFADMAQALKQAGFTAEQIVAAIEACGKLLADRQREQAAKRMREWRKRDAEKRNSDAENRNSYASDALHTLHPEKSMTYKPNGDAKKRNPRARVGDNLSTTEIAGKEKESTPSVSVQSSYELFTETSPTEKSNEIVDWFEDQWNAMAQACGLSTIRAMTDKRVRLIRCRADDLVKALRFADPRAGFVDTFNRIRGSPFLRGSNNGGWRIDVDWLLAEGNFLKIHEGKYAADQKTTHHR